MRLSIQTVSDLIEETFKAEDFAFSLNAYSGSSIQNGKIDIDISIRDILMVYSVGGKNIILDTNNSDEEVIGEDTIREWIKLIYADEELPKLFYIFKENITETITKRFRDAFKSNFSKYSINLSLL